MPMSACTCNRKCKARDSPVAWARSSELRHLKHFREDYPQARTRLAYGGDERLEVNGILCLPAGELLQGIVPGFPLP